MAEASGGRYRFERKLETAMAALLILIPNLIGLVMIFVKRWPAYRVAQQFYVPIVLIFPMLLYAKIGGFAITAASITALVLAISGWMASSRKLNLVDVCVIALAINTFISDLATHPLNVSMYSFYFYITKWVCPYFIGRTLIEQYGMRKAFARTFALCLAGVAILSIYEYVSGNDLWKVVIEKLTHIVISEGGQFRWGFARVAGPYGHAIIAGLVFSIGIFLQIWLMATKTELGSPRLRFLRSRRAPVLVTLAIALGLFMTQSRGPWIGCGFGLVIALTGMAKNRKQAAIVCLFTLVIGGSVTSTLLDKYTKVDVSRTKDRDQLNAAYRRDLLATYTPVIEQGGLFGWGSPRFLGNGFYGYGATRQSSIDNEYIRLTVAMGYVGITLFLLTLALCHVQLIRLCMTLKAREDFLFAYCLLGALLCSSFTISTVALLDPMMQILFLLLGWSQSLQPSTSAATQPAMVRVQQFEFERVFV